MGKFETGPSFVFFDFLKSTHFLWPTNLRNVTYLVLPENILTVYWLWCCRSLLNSSCKLQVANSNNWAQTCLGDLCI